MRNRERNKSIGGVMHHRLQQYYVVVREYLVLRSSIFFWAGINRTASGSFQYHLPLDAMLLKSTSTRTIQLIGPLQKKKRVG